MTNNLVTPIFLLLQVALLVIAYGNIIPGLPWFVIWFPTLITAVITAVTLIAILLMWRR